MHLNKNYYKNSLDEVSFMQQIQVLLQQGKANNSNLINLLNQTIIQQKQQIQSLDGKISSLEAKLQEFVQKPQQNTIQKFESQQNQMKFNQSIQQVQPQQVFNTWKPVILFANYKIKYSKG
ncbi:hypothetical protein ABPG72_020496 [Tetrahymena utriculariae]